MFKIGRPVSAFTRNQRRRTVSPSPIAMVEALETRTLLSFTATNNFGLDTQSNTIDVPAKTGDFYVHDFSVTITNDAGLSTATINASQINADGTVDVVINGSVQGPKGFGSLNQNHEAVLDFYLDGKTTTSVAHITSFADKGIGADQRDTIAYSTTVKVPAGEHNTNLGLVFSNILTHQQTPLIPMTTITVDTVKPTISGFASVNPVNLAPVDQVSVVMTNPIAPASFTASAVSLTRDGVPVALSSAVTIVPVAGSAVNFTISGLSASTQQPGNYVLTVNATGLHDTALNSGTGSKAVSFAVQNVAPVAHIVVSPTKFPKKGGAVFSGSGQDGNPLDTLQYNWVATIQVKAKKRGKPPTTKTVATGTGTSFTLNTKVKGVYTVNFTVTDNHGASASTVTHITHK